MVVNVVCIGSSIFITQIRERYQCASLQRAGSEGGRQKTLQNCKSFPSIFFVTWFLSHPSPIIALPCHYNWLTNSLMRLWLMRMVAQYLLSILGVSLEGIIWRCRTAHWNASLMTKYLERIAPTGHRGGRCSLFSAMQCFKWCDVYQFLIIQYLGDALKKKKKNIDHGAPVADERTKNFLWSNCQQRARMFFLTLSRLSEKTSTSMVLTMQWTMVIVHPYLVTSQSSTVCSTEYSLAHQSFLLFSKEI